MALAIGALAGVGIGWFAAGRVLRPVDRITGVARDIQATDLSRRIALEGPDDEMKELADTFDGMLGRLDEAFEGQRHFFQEASHELRNPLAVIRTNLDVLNVQQNVYSARRDLANAYFQYMLAVLRLKSAVGNLTEQDLENLNRRLNG